MRLLANGVRMSWPATTQRIVLPREDFCNPNSAMDRLFEVFPDKYPALVAESPSDWTFELGWPRHILEPIDPLLPEKASMCFGLELSGLEKYVELRSHSYVPFVFSMFHSQALLAPALGMQMTGKFPQVIVHVDAHHDLSPSLLGLDSDGMLVNEAFSTKCRLDRPDTISQAIDTGFLNKANFLTAFMLVTPTGRVFHVDPACNRGAFVLESMTQRIKLGHGYTSQHAFRFGPAISSCDGKLFESPELPRSLHLEAGESVWLDVDLDAFCNRFDGDSDNRGLVGSTDEMNAMVRRAEGFLKALAGVDWLGDIGAVSVASSPGFFPSEYWEVSVPFICDGIMGLL